MLESMKMKSTNSEHKLKFVNLNKWSPVAAPSGCLNFLCISDVHMGHGRVPTRKIIQVCDEIMTDEAMEVVDVVIVSGDLFDKRLAHDSDDALLISDWMDRKSRQAKRKNVIWLTLEGTPSHDNRQTRWFLHSNRSTQAEADIRYYENIVIDELFPGGPTFLFIQDEVNHDANKTWKQVCDAMKEKGLDKVDFAVMHGMFTFQEPVRSIATHLEERYEGIVRHRIIIGHHHHPEANGKIRVPGSVERLRHNEEHDKGFYFFTWSPTEGVIEETFVVNTAATTWMTLDVVGKSFAETVGAINKVAKHPDGSHFRLKLSREDESYAALSRIKNIFPHFNISTKVIEATATAENTDNLIDAPPMPSINEGNLCELMLPRFSDVTNEDVMRIIEMELRAA